MVRPASRCRQSAALLVLAIHVMGCTAHVTVDPFEMPEAHGAKIPASIGVYFPPGFTSYPVREQIVEESESMALETDIGPASRSVIEGTLRSSFDEVIVVESENPEALVEGRIDAVVVPSITHFDYEQYGGTTRVVVRYTIELLHRDGRTGSIAAVGRETDKPQGGFGFEYLGSAAPKKIAEAMRAAGTELWFRMHAAANEEDWFEGLARFAGAELAEIQGTFAPIDGHCSVFIYLEDSGYYDEYIDTMLGVIIFAGEDRQRWLPDAGRFTRHDLRPARYAVRYGPAALVRAFAGEGDAALSEVTETIEIDCQAGRSHIYGLRFWTAAALNVNVISPADAAGEIRLRTVVTDADPKRPPM